jgi:hypothetical protein
MRASVFLALILVASAAEVSGASEIMTAGSDLAVDVSRVDGRLVMDLAGKLWTLPPNGGEAALLLETGNELRRPRWSPEGDRVIYQSVSDDGSAIWLTDVAAPAPRRISPAGTYNQDASWHPDGERIVFASERHDSGLDLWEADIATGLSWRLTSSAADEYEPAWSANGRHLAWISRNEDGYALMLRRRGEADVALVESVDRLSAPAWRPDGSLLTFVRHGSSGPSLEMVILSDPILVRVIEDDESIVPAPVSWRDRQSLFYTADGLVRHRNFEDRRSRPLHFRAILKPDETSAPPPVIPRRDLQIVDAPEGRLVVRAARLFDGLRPGYRREYDVIIDGGRVTAVEPRRARDDGTVLDLGDATIMPGLVDAWSAIDGTRATGAGILAYGVTTVAVEDTDTTFDFTAWEGEDDPGPRVLEIDDVGRASSALSIADSGVDAVRTLLGSRQAMALNHTSLPPRRFASLPALAGVAGTIVSGSKPNRMPPGIAVHAELLALAEAGLTGEQALHAVGRNAARALGLEFQVGAIMPGAVADLVLVRGDPLADVGDSMNVVAVIRNGRFFSLVSLLERARRTEIVE